MSVATAAVVRADVAANPAKYDGLTVGSRGNLPPEVVKTFNKGRKAGRRYERGATKAATLAAREQAAADRAKALAAGVKVGARGRLSKEALAVVKPAKVRVRKPRQAVAKPVDATPEA